jgi:hypothetical protein
VRVLDDEDHRHDDGRATRDQPGVHLAGPGLRLSAAGWLRCGPGGGTVG